MPDPSQELMFEILKGVRDDIALLIRTSNFLVDEARANRELAIQFQRRQIATDSRLERIEAQLEDRGRQLDEQSRHLKEQGKRLERIEGRLGLPEDA